MGRSIFLILLIMFSQLIVVKCALEVDEPIKNEIVNAIIVNVDTRRYDCREVSFEVLRDNKIVELTLCGSDLVDDQILEKNKVYKLSKTIVRRTSLKGTSMERTSEIVSYEFLNYVN